MQKIIRISLYLSVLAFYNITTLYTAVIHDHKFKWTDDESCPAYIISVSQISDTFSFSVNNTIYTSNEKIIDFQSTETFQHFEFNNSLCTRAPPSFI